MKKQIVIKLREIVSETTKKPKYTGIIFGIVDDKKTDYKSSSGTFTTAHSCGVNLANKIPDIQQLMEQIQ